tara:strand:- start:141 stop:290 length:150 start_codon:yes stop_codon:yes gene_type:complete
MIESITFNTSEFKLVVVYKNETSKEYFDRQTYIIDNPDREADCDAMGWE